MISLSKIRRAGFDITVEDGDLIISPFSKLQPNQLEFLKQHKAEIIQELKKPDLSGTDKAAILRWLHYIGENNQKIIDEVMGQCRSDPKALAYFFGRSREIPEAKPAKPIQCQDCMHFRSFNGNGGAGACSAGVQPKGITHWFNNQHSCGQFQTQEAK
jgi:hypothetical protein